MKEEISNLLKNEPVEDDVLKLFMEKISGCFFITDPQARILYATKSIENDTGFSVAETIGRKPGQLWGGRMNRFFYQQLWHTLAQRRKPFIAEVTNQSKNGRVYSQQLFLAPITASEDGELRYFLAFRPVVPGTVFSQRFLNYFSKTTPQPSQFVDRIFSGIRRDGIPTPIYKLADHYSSLSDFLQKFFIEPMQRGFSYRDDDRKLVQDAQKDRQLFRRLYEKYYSNVYRYFLHRLSFETQQADDFSQETFTRALLYLPHFQPSNASYLTYLLRIAHNMLVNFYRRKKDYSYEYLDTIPSADTDYLSLLEKKQVWYVLQHLSQIERSIILMKYKEGYAVREIAVSLNKTENAIKLHLSRARKKLRKIMTAINQKGA